MPKVTLIPNGTTFDAREHESILQAGLNAGVALDYGCSNGNCGDCLARLVSGKIGKIRHFDFTISESNKSDGYFPMCCYQAESNIVLEAPEASAVSEIPEQCIDVQVKKIEQLNEQIIKLHLRTPRSSRLRFMAGQIVNLGGDGIPEGIYPIASCPCDDMNLYFHIPDIPGDDFSEWLFAGNLKKNTKLKLNGPMGRFVLGKDIARPILLVSWHTGFASMQALVEHAISVETELDIHLYRLAPAPGLQYLDNLCRSWSDAFDNFHYAPLANRYTLMSDEAQGKEILQDIAKHHENLRNMDIFIAGPPSLTNAAINLFDDMGLPKDQLKCETIVLGFYDD